MAGWAMELVSEIRLWLRTSEDPLRALLSLSSAAQYPASCCAQLPVSRMRDRRRGEVRRLASVPRGRSGRVGSSPSVMRKHCSGSPESE